jgi:hypothetical protein
MSDINFRDIPLEILEKITDTLTFEETQNLSNAVVKYIPYSRCAEVFMLSRQIISDEAIFRTIKDFPIATTSICMLTTDYDSIINLIRRFPNLKFTTEKLSYRNDSLNNIKEIDERGIKLLNYFRNLKQLEISSCKLSLNSDKLTSLILDNVIIGKIDVQNLLRLDLTKVKSINYIENILTSNLCQLKSLNITFQTTTLIDMSEYINKLKSLNYLKMQNVSMDCIENLDQLKYIFISGYCSNIKNCARLHHIKIIGTNYGTTNDRGDTRYIYMPKITNCPSLLDININYACIHSNLLRLYSNELEVFDPNATRDFFDIRELTMTMKFGIINRYFDKNGNNFIIRTSNLNENDVTFHSSEIPKYYIYKGHRLVNETNFITNYNEYLNINLINLLELCDQTYYGV